MIPANVEENLHYIELVTRKKIRNLLVGNYTSVLKGHGYDFIDHKVYQPGDDIRKIDWNATARSAHPLVKSTHEERDLDLVILADLSSSMHLATGPYSKRELLLYVTAGLAYSALSDDIRVGFIGFSDQVEIEIKPAKGKAHLWGMLQRIWDFEPGHRGTRVVPVLDRVNRDLAKMSMLFLVSDFLFQEDIFQELAFKRLAVRHDLIPVLLKDPWETHLPGGKGFIWFRDLESGHETCVRLSPDNRVRYAQALADRRRQLKDRFYEHGLDYLEVQTDEEFHQLLAGLFLMRKRR